VVQGFKKWTKIAKAIKDQLGIDGRTGKQCRERWHNHLNPDLNKNEWTEEEELKIFELQKQLGNKWSEIATLLPGRTDNSIKNCFYSAVRRNLRKYNKKRPESEKLKGSVKSLLRKPATRAILMNSALVSVPKEGFKQLKPGKSLKKIETASKKYPELICPTISPFSPLPMFDFPITPSTTPSILSSKLSANYFSFPEVFNFENIYPKSELELNNDGLKSEQNTPKYFLPHFSPKTNFQHYFTPRNSNSE
jgi:Myb-like DNA-binding domain